MSDGFIMGRSKSDGELIRYAGDGPIISIAPTGAGKTSGSVICNALTHPGQLICVDVKGKVYDASAERRRQMGQEVYKIDLRDTYDSDSMNPMDLVRHTGNNLAALGRGMAAEMIERTGHERDTFWNNSAETMIAGGLTYLWSHKPKAEQRLETLFDLYSKNDVPFSLAVLLDTVKNLDKATYAAWANFCSLPDITRGGVHGTLMDQIRLFDNTTVNRCIEKTSFDIDDLIAGAPISIYIIVPPYRMLALRLLLRLMVSSLLNLFFFRTKAPAERTLLLVDEAYQLGRLDSLLVASTLGREYGITLHTIWQNAAQLDIYGTQSRTIIDNVGAFQCFGMRNQRMANEIADLIGGFTGEQLREMGNDEMLLSVDGSRPEIAKQVRYYQDRMFTGMYPKEMAR